MNSYKLDLENKLPDAKTTAAILKTYLIKKDM